METLTAGEGALLVEVQGQRVGLDVVVTIGGGTRAHVGAVAVAQPRPACGATPGQIRQLDAAVRTLAAAMAERLGLPDRPGKSDVHGVLPPT